MERSVVPVWAANDRDLQDPRMPQQHFFDLPLGDHGVEAGDLLGEGGDRARGEVIFAAASTLTHQVFNGPPHMNRTYCKLRHQ